MKQSPTIIKLSLSVLIGLLTSISLSHAQELKGIVYELESSQQLKDVFVKNLRTKEETKTDAKGNFSITATINDYLVFNQAGYNADTAFIYQEGIQRIYLTRDNKSIIIDEIVVSRLTDSRLLTEIARAQNDGKVTEASQHQGGLRVSPSRLFGKKGKLARKNLDLLLKEQNNRKVDRLFADKVILGIVPLNENELPLFREQFRPSLDFIQQASPEDVRLYIIDSYSKFKKQK